MTSLDGADVVLQDDLLVGMVEAQVGKLTPMPPDPMTTGRDPPVTQQERMQLLARLSKPGPAVARTRTQISNGLVGGIRNPDRRQFVGPVQRTRGVTSPRSS